MLHIKTSAGEGRLSCPQITGPRARWAITTAVFGPWLVPTEHFVNYTPEPHARAIGMPVRRQNHRHVLQAGPLHNNRRRQLWPVETPVPRNLIGSLNDLQYTAVWMTCSTRQSG